MEIRKVQPVDREIIHLLASEYPIEEQLLEEAFEDSKIHPDKEKWSFYLEKFTLSLGIAFLLFGLMFFLAYNWTDLHKFAKLGIVQGVLLILGAFLFFRKKLDFTAQLLLTGVVFMIGISFAVFGQIYQTGADAYDLFLVWTLAAIPFTVISRFPALWLIFLILANITLHFWQEQVLGYTQWDSAILGFFLLNLIATVVWELGILKLKWSYTSRWFPRAAILVAGFYLTLLICIGVSRGSYTENRWYYPVAYMVGLVFYPSVVYIYLKHLKDLLFVSASIIGMMVILCAWILRFVDDDLGGFFLAGTMCMGVTIYTVKLLVRTHREWKKQESVINFEL